MAVNLDPAKRLTLDGDSRWFEIYSAYNRVQQHIKENFEPSVWFGHAGATFTKTFDKNAFGYTVGLGKGRAMMPVVNKSAYAHTTSRRIKDEEFVYVVNTWCTAGRAFVEIESREARITLITEDGSMLLRMGIQGIDATESQAIDLLRRTEAAWLDHGFRLWKGSRRLDD